MFVRFYNTLRGAKNKAKSSRRFVENRGGCSSAIKMHVVPVSSRETVQSLVHMTGSRDFSKCP